MRPGEKADGSRGGPPAELSGGRQGPLPAPPVDTAAQLLPFGELDWKDFERLCLRLAELEGEPIETRLYGTQGQDQQGIDIYSRLHGEEYATYQCRRWEKVGVADFDGAIDDFRGGEWASKSARFVFCTSATMVRTELVKAIETKAGVLEKEGTELAVWDAERLSVKLKVHPGLVEDFFGRAWAARFSRVGTAGEMQTVELLRSSGLGESGQLRVMLLDWAPERVKKELKALGDSDPSVFAALTAAISEPPRTDELASLLDPPPDWLLAAGAEVWTLVARLCEDSGAWTPARRAWEESAKRKPGRIATFLAFAATAAGMDGDGAAERRLLSKAREIDPDEPQIALAELDDTAPAQERLETLAKLHSDDPEVQSMIGAQRSLAALLVPDLELAAEEWAPLQAAEPEGTLAIICGVNLAVQRGRLAVVAVAPLDIAELRDARARALDLRDRLLRQRRFEESARLLMMAADASALMGERQGAAQLLAEADPAELAAETGAEVLAASAAGRALDFRLCLKLVANAPEGPGRRFLEAECLEEIGNADQRKAALETLDQIVAEDGPNSAEAAFVRLAATLGGRRTAWSDVAARYLREHDHEKAAVTAEVFYLARWHSDYARAEELLAPHLNQLWAKVTRMRLAATRGAYGPMKEAADAVMAAGPSQQLRLEAGRTYARAGHVDRAREVLLGVARDPGAPVGVRAAAYSSLIPIVGNAREWIEAKMLLGEWIGLDPTDERASALYPTVVNRAAQESRRP